MSQLVSPGRSYTSRLALGAANTGLTGTVRFRLLDNDQVADDPIYGPSSAGIIEDPTGSGSYVFDGTAPDTAGNYARAWDRGAGTDLIYDEDLIVSSNAPGGPATGDYYATVDELARVLQIKNPTDAQTTALERVLLTAAGEINSEIDLADGDTLEGWQIALATEVNLERAVEHWRDEESSFGILGLGDTGPIYTARNSWERYAFKLAPLKDQWGIA